MSEIDTSAIREQNETLSDGMMLAPLFAVNCPSDWGLQGAIYIVKDDNVSFLDSNNQMATIPYVTPYPIGASRKDQDAAREAKAYAKLFAASPLLISDTERLCDEVDRLRAEVDRVNGVVDKIALAIEKGQGDELRLWAEQREMARAALGGD